MEERISLFLSKVSHTDYHNLAVNNYVFRLLKS
jgi:hypothetical protein